MIDAAVKCVLGLHMKNLMLLLLISFPTETEEYVRSRLSGN